MVSLVLFGSDNVRLLVIFKRIFCRYSFIVRHAYCLLKQLEIHFQSSKPTKLSKFTQYGSQKLVINHKYMHIIFGPHFFSHLMFGAVIVWFAIFRCQIFLVSKIVRRTISAKPLHLNLTHIHAHSHRHTQTRKLAQLLSGNWTFINIDCCHIS